MNIVMVWLALIVLLNSTVLDL